MVPGFFEYLPNYFPHKSLPISFVFRSYSGACGVCHFCDLTYSTQRFHFHAISIYDFIILVASPLTLTHNLNVNSIHITHTKSQIDRAMLPNNSFYHEIL